MNLVSHTTTRIRWTIGINGALSVVFGAMILAWPRSPSCSARTHSRAASSAS